MATILMPLPHADFDPSESGIPWRVLKRHRHSGRRPGIHAFLPLRGRKEGVHAGPSPGM